MVLTGKKLKPKKVDKLIKREVCQVSSRGVRVYTAIDTKPLSPTSLFLLSIVENYDEHTSLSTFGVCFIDTTIGEFHLSQFEDDQCKSRLMTLLAHHPPGHLIYERDNLSSSTLKILNNHCQGVTKEALIKETQFWSAKTVLKVRLLLKIVIVKKYEIIQL